MSISTQKTMLKDYAKRNGFLNCQFYVDDGYSGTNYDRPAFRQLIEDIQDGEVSTLITKDLSCLGRNYLETGTYIEVFFPNHNVWYIAINDGVDSIDNAQMDISLETNCISSFRPFVIFIFQSLKPCSSIFNLKFWSEIPLKSIKPSLSILSNTSLPPGEFIFKVLPIYSSLLPYPLGSQ